MSYFGRSTSFSNNSLPVGGAGGGGRGLAPRMSAYNYNPNVNTIRPNSSNKYCRPQTNNFNGGIMPKYGYGRSPYGFVNPSESRWSFGNSGEPQAQQQQRKLIVSSYSPGGMTNHTRSTSMIGPTNNSTSMIGRTNNITGRYCSPASVVGPVRSSGRVKHFSPPPVANTVSTPVTCPSPVSVSTSGQPASLPDGDNVNYVRLNWEDILGGKDGLNKLRVTMAPPNSETGNRQLQIGFGGAGESQATDGSVPLKVLKFEPVENYPGQMTNSGSAPTLSPPAIPVPSSNAMTVPPANSGSAPAPTTSPASPVPSSNAMTEPSSTTPSSNVYGSPQVQVTTATGFNGQTQYPVIQLPPGYEIAPSSGIQMMQSPQGPMMMVPMGNTYGNGIYGSSNNFGNGQFSYQQQQQQQQQYQSPCGSCSACQFKQPASMKMNQFGNRRR